MDARGTYIFPNRTQYWNQRHSLTSTHGKHSDDNDLPNAGELPQADMKYVTAAIAALRICIYCDNADPSRFHTFTVDDHKPGPEPLTLTQCLRCGHLYGVDDSMSNDDVATWLMSLPLQLCSCGNTDSFKYRLCETDGAVFIRCECCLTEIRGNPANSTHNLSETNSKQNQYVSNSGQDQHGANYKQDHKKERLRPPYKRQRSAIEKVVCNKCKNEGQENFAVTFTEEKASALQCKKCQEITHLSNVDDFPDIGTDDADQATCDGDEAILNSKPMGKTMVVKAEQLKRGDHVAWWRWAGYWHHALVLRVHPHENAITAVHFGKATRILIHMSKLFLKKENGILYKIGYDGPCFPPQKAIENALSVMSSTGYNLFTNNCEHFIRWCKTGKKVSEQVWDLVKYLGSEGLRMGSHVITKGLARLGGQAVITAASDAAVYSLDEAANAAVSVATAAEFVGPAAVVGIELVTGAHAMYKIYKQKKENKIDTNQCIHMVVGQVAKGVCRTAGAAVGGVVGSFIPIPVVGSLIGFTIGSIIGHSLGVMAHKGFALCQRAYLKRRLSVQSKKAESDALP